MSSIDLNLAVALAALLEERNVTRAGRRVNMSQPAMSAALARLRVHFGDELLHRVGRRYELTPLGASLLPVARRALTAAEVALGRRTAFDPAASGRHFTVAISDYAITVLAEPLLAALASRAPHVVVDLEPLPPAGSDLPSHLTRCDLLVGPLGYELPGLRAEVFRDWFVCIVAAGNPRLRRLAELCRERLSLVIAEVPFRTPELVEAAHWHPARDKDPALAWLRDLFVEVARDVAG